MITIVSKRIVNLEGIPPFRHADIIISDGQQSFSLGVGGLPLEGDLQPILDARFDELWIIAEEKQILPDKEIFSRPIQTPAVYADDIFVSSRDIKDDPDEAFVEAKAETEKSKGAPKSLDLISRSTLKALEKAREEIKALEATVKDLEKRLKKLEKQ